MAFLLEINTTSMMKTSNREAVRSSGQENMPWSLVSVPPASISPGDRLLCIPYTAVASRDLWAGHYYGTSHNRKQAWLS